MSCKPTVGETRECAGALRNVRTRVRSGRWFVEHRDCGRSRIVEVAPKNRARVTAGPSWLNGARL